MKKTNKKFSVYAMVSEKIIGQLDNGLIPWEKPWVCGNGGGAVSRVTGKSYSLLNQLMLPAGEYATMNDINKEGGKVNKGSHGYQVVFWRMLKKDAEDNDGNAVLDKNGNVKQQTIPMLRYYTVFNITDTTLEPKRGHAELPSIVSPDARAEAILTAYYKAEGLKVVRHQESDKAFYQPSTDTIVVPKMEQFKATAEYYSTVFHETVHSTGAPKRLNRINTTARFGSHDYGKEELVAEIGAAALNMTCQLATDTSERNNKAYIQNWRDAIAKDDHLVVAAAGRAQKAYDLIMSYAPDDTPEPPEKTAEADDKKADDKKASKSKKPAELMLNN